MAGKKSKKPVMEGLRPENNVTDEEKEILIDMVKNCPSLWDSGSPDYKKNKDNEVMWMHFTKKMGFDCKNTFKNLRNYYSAFRRATEPRSGAAGGKKVKTFPFQEKMGFLNRCIVARHRVQKVTSSMAPKATPKTETNSFDEDDGEEDDKEGAFDQDQEEVVEIADAYPSSDDELEKKPKKKRKSEKLEYGSVLNAIVEKMPQIPVIPPAKLKEGSFESFSEEVRQTVVTWGNMLMVNNIRGSVLREFSRRTQRDILNLAEADDDLNAMYSI